MLKKLFRYDFRAMGRVNLPVCLIGFGLSMLSCIAVYLLSSGNTEALLSPLGPLYALLMIPLVFIPVCGIAAVGIVPMILLITHTKEHFFGNEGYTTMTLPASTHELLLSKYFAGLIYMAIGAVLAAIYFFIGLVLPLELSSIGGGDVTTTPAESLDPFFIYMLVDALLSFLMTVFHLIFAVVAAFTLVRKGRFLIGALLYYAVGGLATYLLDIFAALWLPLDFYMSPVYYVIKWVLLIGATVGAYYLSVFLLRNKLNLD